MGLLDSLKKFFESARPPVMEPRRVQYDWGVMRVPHDWQFTHADLRSFEAQGPDGCSVVITIRPIGGTIDTEKARKGWIQTMKGLVQDPSARVEETSGNGLWAEAAPTGKGEKAVLRLAIYRPAGRAQGASRPPLLVVACSAPAPSGRAAFDQVRSALRSIEWS